MKAGRLMTVVTVVAALAVGATPADAAKGKKGGGGKGGGGGASVEAGQSVGKPADLSKPVKVFIMLGQSNMVGMGKLGSEADNGSLAYYCKTEKKYPYLLDAEGKWTQRNDVRCAMVTCDNEIGWLKPGFGAKSNIGPELGFGFVVGDAIDEGVLLIKACIGNRSLGWDLLPPGSEPYDGQPGYRGTPQDLKGNGEIPAGAG
jgi:hypothetical protein